MGERRRPMGTAARTTAHPRRAVPGRRHARNATEATEATEAGTEAANTTEATKATKVMVRHIEALTPDFAAATGSRPAAARAR